MNARAAWCLLFAAFALLLTAHLTSAQPPTPGGEPSRSAPVTLSVGTTAPNFTLTDTSGKLRHLSDFRGRRVSLFFFCGCEACADIMRAWGQAQRTDRLFRKEGSPANAPVTLVVYTAQAADVAQAAKRNALSLASTTLLPDPELAVSLDLYHVEPCPRVFVLDKSGVIRYTNDHADDAPQKASGSTIADKALSCLRSLPSVASKAVPARLP